jgi:outer membrane protein assembly factor BamB
MNQERLDPMRSGRTRRELARGAALLLGAGALAGPLAGCGLFDSNKPKLPGVREPVLAGRHGLAVDDGPPLKVVLPPPVENANWPQDGGNPAHLMGHLATHQALAEAWTAGIGAGGGYRRKILAQPVVANGLIYTMDSNAVVSAFDVSSGNRRWRFDSKHEDTNGSNIGGGLAVDQGVLYAVNGVADVVAIDAAKGTQKWRTTIDSPARSSPTIADGRLFVTTIEDKLRALATADGRALWSYQAANVKTSLLGRPAPAYADGLVVVGFGSGELTALRADSGGVAWTDSLAAADSSGGLADLSAIRGLPVISNGRVYAIGLGGLFLALDLRSGRRLWEREVAGEDSLWCAGNWLFVVSVGQQIAAVSTDDGRVAWVSDLPYFQDPDDKTDSIQWFGPLLAADRLIVAGTNREALAISPYTGAVLGRQKLSGAASLGPILAAGTVYIITDDGRLLALR